VPQPTSLAMDPRTIDATTAPWAGLRVAATAARKAGLSVWCSRHGARDLPPRARADVSDGADPSADRVVAAAVEPSGQTAAFVVLRRHRDPAEWSVGHLGTLHGDGRISDGAVALCLLVALDAIVALGARRLWAGPAARYLRPTAP
jgi:hypothetical protein